jgi:cytochrome c oxidase cbb3-type subunit 2
MLWGSKRTGPDLARIGGKYSDPWQVRHLLNPRDVVPSSIMPRYGWLAENELEVGDLGEHLAAQRTVGVPYTKAQIEHAPADAVAQASPEGDTAGLVERYGQATRIGAFDGDPRVVTEMDALVAYLQVLGKLTDKAAEQQQLAGR